MARGINKVILIGNLGKDPESKTFANGGSITNVTLATSDAWKDKDGQQQERTEWHNVVFHNRLGEIAAQYLRKGSKVYVEGALRTRKWQDKEGKDRYTTEIHANEMQMLDARGAGGGGGDAGFGGGGGGSNYGAAGGGYGGGGGGGGGARGAAPSRSPAPAAPDSGFRDDPIDDIPF